MIKIFEKVYWPVMIVIVAGLFSILIYQNIQTEKKQEDMYVVQYNREEIWTEGITYNSDGSIQFINYENNRPYKVYGGNYVIIEPKIK
jgi:hypothetical protein